MNHITKEAIAFIKSGESYYGDSCRWDGDYSRECACGYKEILGDGGGGRNIVTPFDVSAANTVFTNYCNPATLDCMECALAYDEALGGQYESNPVDNLRDFNEGNIK